MAAGATALPSILLILAMVATIAVAHQRPPPTNETLVLKKCSDALGPAGGAPLVTFCAKDLLGHRAALLATCGKRETLAVVLKETHKRVEAVVQFGKKIFFDKSLSGKERRDLKMCWASTSAAVETVGKIYFAVTNLPYDVVRGGVHNALAKAKEQCLRVPAAEKRSSLWKELDVKSKEAMEAEIVAMAFMDELHNLLN